MHSFATFDGYTESHNRHHSQPPPNSHMSFCGQPFPRPPAPGPAHLFVSPSLCFTRNVLYVKAHPVRSGFIRVVPHARALLVFVDVASPITWLHGGLFTHSRPRSIWVAGVFPAFGGEYLCTGPCVNTSFHFTWVKA